MVIALYINRATMRCIRLLTTSPPSSRSTEKTTAGQEDAHVERLGCEMDSLDREHSDEITGVFILESNSAALG